MSKRQFLVGVAVSALVASGGAAASQELLKLGLVQSMTGAFNTGGKAIVNGALLYLKQHGEVVAGRKIEVSVKDDASAPDTAKRLAQELIVNDKVAILGAGITPAALSVAPLVTDAKIPTVVMLSGASITVGRSPYMVRTSFTVWAVNEVLGAWAYKNGVRKVYTLVADFGPGHDGEAAFSKGFKDAGGEIIGSARYPVANVDFSAFIQRAKDLNPDGIYIWVPGGPQPAAIGKAIAELGIDKNKVKVMGQGELTQEDALRSMGDAGLGLITAFHYDYNHQSDMNKKFVADYNAEFKRNPDIFSIGGYDGAHLIYEALKKTGGKADGDSLIAAAKGMSWESPRGPIMIDPETRDIVQTVYIRRVQKVGDKLENVEFDKVENVKDPAKARMK